MGRVSLNSVEGRLALVDNIFVYPNQPHSRKHGPHGYKDYEAYREWLRDEFSYRCVFSLFRETWPGFSFHIDHLIPQRERPDLICEYDNLIYLESKLNLSKGRKRLPDPCDVALGKCLSVQIRGERIGEIEAKNDMGELIIRVLKLDAEMPTAARRKMLGILRSVAKNDEALFAELVGYPALPNLNSKVVPVNRRPEGLNSSAWNLQNRQESVLPEWI